MVEEILAGITELRPVGDYNYVRRGFDTALEREVILRPKKRFRGRQAKIAEAVAGIPQLQQYLGETTDQDGKLWSKLSFTEGRGLDFYLVGHRLYNNDQSEARSTHTAAWGLQLANILHQLHANGYGYFDLKPGQLIITPDEITLALIDIETVRALDDPSPWSKKMTPNYAPPEAFHEEYTHPNASYDIYGFGTTLYYILTGYSPWWDSKHPFMYGLDSPKKFIQGWIDAKEKGPDNGRVDYMGYDALGDLIQKCMEHQPEDRFQNFGEIIISLHAILRGMDLSVLPKTELEQQRERVIALYEDGLSYLALPSAPSALNYRLAMSAQEVGWKRSDYLLGKENATTSSNEATLLEKEKTLLEEVCLFYLSHAKYVSRGWAQRLIKKGHDQEQLRTFKATLQGYDLEQKRALYEKKKKQFYHHFSQK